MVFFFQLNHELLESSNAFKKYKRKELSNLLHEEMRLLLMFLDLDDCLLITPTAFYEDELDICLEVINKNLSFAHEGFIRLYYSESNLDNFLGKKQLFYKRLIRIERYKNAYFAERHTKVISVPLIKEEKLISVGSTSLEIWLSNMRKLSEQGHINPFVCSELIKRVTETEKDSFLWESAMNHLEHINASETDKYKINLRDQMNISYLKAYKEVQGILLPQGSFAVNNYNSVITNSSYNIFKLRRITQGLGIFEKIVNMKSNSAYKIKTSQLYRDFAKYVNQLLSLNIDVDTILHKLQQDGYEERVRDLFFKTQDKRKRGTAMSENNNKVFVVSGKNDEIRRSFFSFLRSGKIEPLEWEQAVTMTGTAPYIGDVIDNAMNQVKAIIVLMTDDEHVQLKDELAPDGKLEAGLQPRPNVIFEAGMALGKYPTRTIIVSVGKIRPISDIQGRHEIRFDGSFEKRNAVFTRLETAGCKVDRSGSDWQTVGTFN